jgi:hypothetical protein
LTNLIGFQGGKEHYQVIYRELFYQIVDGLVAIHSASMSHGRVDIENIYVLPHGNT